MKRLFGRRAGLFVESMNGADFHRGSTLRQAQASGKGQESPARTVPEENASRAGGLRPVVGSGKKGTRAANGRPPKT
jgi:hypothetical protein